MTDKQPDDPVVGNGDDPPSADSDPPTISDHPNPWAMLHDDTKTFVTLAVALLGLTATFAQELINRDGRVWISIGWILLGLAVFSTFFASGKIQEHVRTGSTSYGERSVNAWANAVFFLLLLGTGFVAVAAGIGLWSGDAGVADMVSTAIDAVVEVREFDADSLEVESFEREQNRAAVVIRQAAGDRFVVLLDVDTLTVLGVESAG